MVRKIMRKQQGITFMGLVFVLVVLAFTGLVGLKLFPFYMTSFKIDKAMTAVVEDVTMRDQTARKITASIVKRLDIDSVTRIYHRNINEYVTVKNDNGQITIDVFYDEEALLFGNIFLRVEFDKHFEN